jgi:naphtho-gamma-pyrone polyketide synthase
MAIAALWKSLGVEPNLVVGHSLGHYAALNAAGVLTAADTIYLTGTRAQLLVQKCKAGSHAMLAVRTAVVQCRQFLDPDVHEVACNNGPLEVVISGRVEDVDRLADRLAASSIKATRVKVPFAFHSAQVDPILPDLGIAASRITFHPPRIPILCALEGKVIQPGNAAAFGGEHVQRHCRDTVNFEGALRAVESETSIADGSERTLWVEIGPHTVCSSFLRSTLGQSTTTMASLRRNEDCWKVLADGLATLYRAGAAIHWDEYHPRL